LQYGTRHIIDTMKLAGQKVEMVVFCGGLAKNKLYVQTHADVLGWYPCQCTADIFFSIFD